jgi:ATP-dependent phosphofructokinase / diphosphate-dependent phosphofructokinase
MRIGVLTGGGDVPGLNVAIKSIVTRAEDHGHSLLGIRRGWLGLLGVDPSDPASRAQWTMPLNSDLVRTIDRTGGTILHTSRIDPHKLPRSLAPPHLLPDYGGAGEINATKEVVRAVEQLNLDAVIPLGGDGTLRFASTLSQQGVPVVSIPKTMDNDVHGTDYAIGFSTAITRSVDAITALRTTGGSHERIVVVELFGRLSGQTALYSGTLAAADRIVIAESPFDPPRVATLLEMDRLANPSRYSVCVISEGAKPKGGDISWQGVVDPYGRKALGGIGDLLGEACRRVSREGVIVQSLAYLMRSGPPDATDRMIAMAFAALALELMEKGRHGQMCALQAGRFTAVPIDMPLRGAKRVDVGASFDADNYRPRIKSTEGLALFGI